MLKFSLKTTFDKVKKYKLFALCRKNSEITRSGKRLRLTRRIIILHLTCLASALGR